MERIRKNTEKMKNMTAHVNTKVTGLDKVRQLFHARDTMSKGVNSNINVHANTSAVDNVEHKVDHLQEIIDRIHGNNHLKNSFTSTSNGVDHAGNALERLRPHLDNAESHLHRTAHAAHNLKDAFKSAFAGGIVASFAGDAYNAAKTVVSAGWKLNMAGVKAKATWSHVGLNQDQSDSMVKQMDDIRDSSDLDENSIASLQRRFYSLTGSAGQARNLTNEITGFGKAANLSSREVDQMGRTLPRMLSTGKVRASMFNRTFGRTPNLIGAMAKASGHSKSAFLSMVQSGKMTSAQLQKYLTGAAKYSGQAWNMYTQTAGGRLAWLRGLARKAEASATSGLTGSFLKGMKAIGGNNKNLMQVQKSVASISATLGKKVGNFAGKALAFIIKNQKPLLKTGSALFRIVGIMGKTIWKSFSGILTGIFGHTTKASHGLNGFANALTSISRHTTAIRRLTKVMAGLYIYAKIRHVASALGLMNHQFMIMKVVGAVAGFVRSFVTALRMGTTAQAAFDVAADANPFGAIVIAVTAAIAAITGLVVWLHHLYKTNSTVRRAFQAIGRAGKLAFKIITFPARALFKILVAIGKRIWKVTAGVRKKIGGAAHKVGSFFSKGYNKASHAVGRFAHWVSGSNSKASRSSRRAARSSARATRGYLSKSGKYYKHYHKGLTRMSRASYKERQRMRTRYSRRAKASLKKYEGSYRKYEKKRSSLGRKYGKLRAMYSVKSLRTIQRRFKSLRRNILKETKTMYRGTRRWFRRIGRGAGGRFKGIYKAARRWLGRTTKIEVRDFKRMNRNSRRLLDGSVKRYVRTLRMRFKKQKYYDGQLIKQTKRTNTIMRKLPLAWVTKETKDLISNWRRQRRSFVVHNERMTKALVTHIHTMSHHLRNFKDSFNDIFDDLESNIYEKWTKFWTRMHNAAGKGMNSVQDPLNTGASHLNGFVQAFGESSSPLHQMPSISYATGTGALSGVSSIRRPITRLTDAILNDDANNGQETVVHPTGQTEKPQGANVHETLHPGDEVLNASETRLMNAISRPVHLATGTGFFSKLKNYFTGGSPGTVTQSSLYTKAKDKGKHKLLNELQDEVLKSPGQILTGMFGPAPTGNKGVLNDVAQGAYSLGGKNASAWWSALTDLISKDLDSSGSSDSNFLNFAKKLGNAVGSHYVWGGNGGSGYDCSGLVRAALDHFNIHTGGRLAGTEINAFPHISRSSAKPGDLVGNHDHIGIVADNGAHNYYSAFNGSEGIRTFPLDQAHWTTGDSQMLFARVPQLEKQDKDDPDKDKGPQIKATGAVENFVKGQEKPMLTWIDKNLAPLLDFGDISGTAGAWTKDGTQAHHIAQDVFEAAEHIGMDAKHAAAVVGNAWHESAGFEHGLKVNQFGGGGGKGLFQFTGQGSRYGWSPMGQVKSIMANALGSSASSWESSGGSPASLAHSFETIFERGSIPAFAARDAAAERAYQMFGDDNGHARGGHFKRGELMTVGEEGSELIKPDFSGEVIPHEQSQQVINNSRKPVNVKQDVHITVKDGSRESTTKFVDILHQYGDKLARKLSGGDLVY